MRETLPENLDAYSTRGVFIQITVNPSDVELYGNEPMKKIKNKKKKCV